MACTYRFKDASGNEVVIIGQDAMKAFLADGGIDVLMQGVGVAAETEPDVAASSGGRLPPLPIEHYRVEGYYANGAKIKPPPAKSFSQDDVTAISDWFTSVGWEVKASSGPQGVVAMNDRGMTADNIPAPYTTAQRKRDEKARAAAERTDQRRASESEYLGSTDAGKYVTDTFGAALGGFNAAALAKYLSGESKTFDGLLSNRSIDVLEGMGIAAEGRQIKDIAADIKIRYASERQSPHQSHAKAPQSNAAEPVAEEVKAEPEQDASIAKKAAKLREAGQKLAEQAAEDRSRDRNTNTARRARMASSAEEDAAQREAIGKTMIQLADAIESGNVPALEGVTTRAAVEQLVGEMNSAMGRREKTWSYAESERKRGRPFDDEDLRYVSMPKAKWRDGDQSALVSKIAGKRGAPSLKAEILREPYLTQGIYDKAKAMIGEKELNSTLSWWAPDQLKKIGRLRRMGIENEEQLREAINQFRQVKAGKVAEDPVKAAERAIVGKKVGIDFFPTPKPLAKRMAELAGLEQGSRVLEPSAGNGNLADAARDAGAKVDAVEVSDALRNILEAKGHELAGRDFESFSPSEQYDAVIMNPPFSNRMDAAHIMRAWDMVRPGGKLVAIAGEGVFIGQDRKAQEFRDWLEESGAEVERLPEGTFEDKSLQATTGANARLIVMEKPAKSSEPTVFRSSDTINVDGVERPVTNSKGQPIHPTEEGLRNFWRWFAGSKVVDEQGRPLVVYHGTGADFEKFDISLTGKSFGVDGELGFYFTSNPDTAGLYAERSGREGGANIAPAYVKLAAPLVRSDRFIRGPIAFADWNRESLKRRASENGNDGIVLSHKENGLTAEVIVVAFRPDQIKSAIGNAGDFDPANPDIRFRNETDLTKTQAFREWFGDSKMTDKSGKPMLFMHGSPASFDAFDSTKLGTSSSHTSSGLGHFFTRDRATAERYADGGNIYEGWLRIENPYVMMLSEAQAFEDAQESAERRKELQKLGYDGVVILDDQGKPWATVAFEPWQFKSTDNNGNFDEFEDGFRLRNGERIAFRETSSMRNSEPVPRAEAETVIRTFIAEHPGAPKIVLAETFYQLPADIQRDAIAQGSSPTRAKGAMKDNVVYIVLNNHRSMDDFEATLFHEVMSHAGLRKLFGPEFNREMNKLFIGLGGYSGLERIMKARGMAGQFEGYMQGVIQARAQNPELWTDAVAKAVLTDEVFAHIAEQKNAKALRDRFMRIIGMIRDWLRRNGFARLAKMGESDILHLLRKAEDAMKEGQTTPRDGVKTGTREIVDANGATVARAGSPDYENMRLAAPHLGLREVEGPTVFSFAGESSRTADKHSLNAARERILSGENKEAVRKDTGWFEGVDGKWRYEINDKDAKFSTAPSDPDAYADIFDEAANRKNGVPLGKVLDHPALFAAYPKLQAVRLRVDDGLRSEGVYDAEENTIKIRDPYSYKGGVDSALSVLLHEIQHGIQRIEGFATGGSELIVIRDFDKLPFSKKKSIALEVVRNVNRANSRALSADIEDAIANQVALWEESDDAEVQRLAKEAGLTDEQIGDYFERGEYIGYRRLAGEVEARNAQTRRRMTYVERRDTPPSQTADVADSDVIVVFNGKEMASAPTPENAGGSASASSDAPAMMRTAFSAPDIKDTLRSKVADIADSLTGDTAKTFNWWQRTIGSQYGKAKKDKDYAAVYWRGHAFIDSVSDFANRAADKAKGILPHLDSFKDIGAGLNVKRQWADAKDYQAIAQAIFDGTLVNGTTGKVWTDDELRDRYNLTDRQIGFYREFRDAVDLSLDTLGASEMSRLARAAKMDVADIHMGMDDAAKFYTSQLDGRIKEARDAMEGEAGALVARHAEERTAVEELADNFTSDSVLDAVRKEIDRRHKAETAELMKAVNELESLRDNFLGTAEKIHELQKQGYAPLMRFGQYTVDVVRMGEDGKPVLDEAGNPDRPFFGMFESEAEARKAEKALREEYPDYAVTRGVLSTEASQLYRGMTPETAELFARMLGTDKDEAFQAYLKQAVANRSAMKRLIHRVGMEGFATDVPRVLASFITSNSRLASGNWHFGEMAKAVEAIPKHKGDVKDDAIRLMQYVQNPVEEAAGIRGFLFFNFLGGSIASALVNLTQTFTTTLPYLNQFGVAEVAKALPKAMAISGKLMTKRGLESVQDADLRAALQRAQDEGVVDPQEIHLLMAESQGNDASSLIAGAAGMINKEWATPAARVTRAATQAWGSLFGAAEKYNRHVAFIAAWEVAPEGVDRYEFAREAVTETQFDYSRVSRPNWARGAVGATLFTFKTFTINYLEFLSRLPNRERALAIGVLFLFAGLSGMPGSDDLDDVIDTIGQKMGYSWNNAAARHAWIVKQIGKDGANFVEHGISSMLPLDISSRLSVANIAPGSGAFKKSNDNPSRDVQEFFGPAGSMVSAARDVFDNAGSGKGVIDTALPLMPKMFKDLKQAYNMAQTGTYTDMKGRKVVDVDAIDAIIKGVGFQPNVVAEPRRVERMLAQSAGMQRAIRTDIHELVARGVVEGDAEKAAAGRELMRSWNEKNPDAPIRLNPASIAARTRAMRLTSADRLVKATPKEMRGAIAAELEASR